jgi:hypothetical protein
MIIQVRCTNGVAFEKNAAGPLNYAATPAGFEQRMRDLGCPEALITRTRAKMEARGVGGRTAVRATTVNRKPAPPTDADLKRRAANAAAQIDADAKRDRAKQLAVDVRAAKAANEQKQKDNELRRKMDAIAGRTCR